MRANTEDKVVVITGCSTGIGKAAAEILAAKSSYKVIATVRKAEDIATLDLGAGHHVIQLDLDSSVSVQAASQKIIELAQGQLYALFNNAAYGQPGAVEDLSRETLRRQFETNVLGTHELTRALMPELLKQKSARIIQNSSILGFIGMPMRGAYVASKFALEGLTDTLRMELSDTAVRVSLIEPGPITSAFRANSIKALEDNVDFDASRHGWRYVAALARLSKPGPTSKHTLGPEVVVDKLRHALDSSQPHHRYYVTKPTHIMGCLKRIFPSAWIDRILLTYARAE